MANIRSRIGLLVEAQGAKRAATEIDSVSGKVRKLSTDTDKQTSAVKRSDAAAKSQRKSLAAVASAAKIGAVAAVGLGIALGKGAVDEYREAYKVGRQTQAVIRSTGGTANVTAKDVGNLANSISLKAGIDDEAIQKGSNLLLTFKQIRNEAGKGNDIFNRTTQAAVDLSAAGFGSINSASKMLGKSLNDPVKGISALGRAGVTFTAGQKKTIGSLVKQGKALQAQKMILREVESQVKGSAAAQADPIDRAQVAWGNLEETLGGALAPTVTKVAGGFANFITGLHTGQGVGGATATAFRAVGTALQAVWPWLQRLMQTQRFQAVANAARNVAKAFQWAFLNVVLPVLQRAWPGIKAIAQGIVRVLRGIVDFVSGVLTGDWRRAWNGLKSIVSGALKAIGGIIRAASAPFRAAASALWNGLKTAFRSAINWIVKKWNGLEFKIPGFDPPGPGPKFGGFTLGVPDIPLLAGGGTVLGQGSRWISGERGPEIGEVVPGGVKVTPLAPAERADPLGGEMVVHSHLHLDGREIGTVVRRVSLRDMLAQAAT